MQENGQISKPPLKYPKQVFFIVSNEFCERFSYYGMRTILALYLTMSLKYDTDTATVIYHLFAMLCYFSPLFGAIIADTFLGKFRTIFYLSILYAIGNITLSTSSVPILNIPHAAFSFLGLLMISIGTGGIKPCVSAFGGDQFVVPQQQKQLQQFFSLFYFSINSGSLISTYTTPILRKDIQCFGENSCFSLAFGVPALLMIISLVIFLVGKPFYTIKEPKGNVVVTFISCITHAIRGKIRSRKAANKKKDWLQYADDRYSQEQIADIRAVINVLVLFLPLPLFWSLYDQQGSRWTFQATNMDGRVLGFIIKPDQMQVMNPLLILLFIPLFETVLYPVLAKIGIKRPLQKLTLGGLLAASSFLVSAFLELNLERTYPVLPSTGESQIHIFNSLNCRVNVDPAIGSIGSIDALSYGRELHIPVNNKKTIESTLTLDNTCHFSLINSQVEFTLTEEQSSSYFITKSVDGTIELVSPKSFDVLQKNGDALSQIRIFYSSQNGDTAFVEFVPKGNIGSSVNVTVGSNDVSQTVELMPDRYDVVVDGNDHLMYIELSPGSINTLLMNRAADGLHGNLLEVVGGNSVHLFWQLPQIILITAGEILFSVTGLEFSFTQAPESMKSVLSAAWLLTVAFGNLIVVIISEIHFFDSQAYEFLLFAALMIADMGVFAIMAYGYRYTNIPSNTITSNNGDRKLEIIAS